MTAANPITPAVLAHLTVLEHLNTVDRATSAEIATATGKVPSNVKRDMPKLYAEGLIGLHPRLPEEEGPDQWFLTRAGGEALDAMARAADPGAAGGVPFALTSELKPNPKQPRKKFEQEPLERLADTIDEKGILQPLVVRPVGEDGLRVISAGERRWRAACIVNERRLARGDQSGPVRLPYIERDATPEEQAEEEAYAAYIAVVENGQREPLTTYEEALAYRAMIPALYPSARACGKATGVDGKTVSDRLKALEDLTDAQKAEWRDGKLTWREVRDIFRPPAPAETDPNQIDIEEVTGAVPAISPEDVALSPIAELGLLELGWAVLTSPIDDHGGPPAAKVTGYSYMSRAWRELRDAQLITEVMPTVYGSPTCLSWPTEAGFAWITKRLDGGPLDDEALKAARARIGRNGQIIPAGMDEGFYTDVLNDRLGREKLNKARQVWMDPTPAETLLLMEIGSKISGRPDYTKKGAGGEIVDRALVVSPDLMSEGGTPLRYFYSTGLLNFGHERGRDLLRWTSEARAFVQRQGYNGVNDGELQRAREAAGLPAPAPGEYSTAWLNSAPEAKTSPGTSDKTVSTGDLAPRQRLALIEATHKMVAENTLTAGRAARVGSYWLDAACSALVDAQLLRFVNAGGEAGWHVMWGEKAYPWFRANLPEVFTAQDELSIGADLLDAARNDGGQAAWPGPGYATSWLNTGEAAEAAQPPKSPHQAAEDLLATEPTDQDLNDDEDAFDALLTQLREEMGRTHGEPGHWTRVSAPDLAARAFSELMRGDALATIAALVGLMQHTDDPVETARLLHAAGKGDYRPEGKEPQAMLWHAANGVRDLMLKHYEVFNGLPDADFVYRDLSGALNDVSRAKRQDDDVLLVIRKGDVVEKHPGAATQHRILEAQGAIGGRVLFKAQPMRGGKDYGTPGSLPLSDFANFIRGGGR